jgi:hypothetical protein
LSDDALHDSDTLDDVVPVTANPLGADGGVVSDDAGWVVAVTALLAAEVLPAASRALTVKVYEVEALSPVTVAVVAGGLPVTVVASVEPRYTS